MIEVRLSLEDWQRVLAVLAQGPWQAVNPIIMAIGEQLRRATGSEGRPDGPERREEIRQ